MTSTEAMTKDQTMARGTLRSGSLTSSATSAGISNPRKTPAAAAATKRGPVHQEMP